MKHQKKEALLFYNGLQAKLDNFRQAKTLRAATQAVKEWNNDELVNAADQLQAPLNDIKGTVLSDDLKRLGHGSGLPDFEAEQQQLKEAKTHKTESRNQEKQTLTELTQIQDPQEFQTRFDEYKEQYRRNSAEKCQSPRRNAKA